MIFIDEVSSCAICNEPLDRPFLATSGCAFPSGHVLHPFCDAPLHIDCLQDWPSREEFCGAYHEQRLRQYQEERWPILCRGDAWMCGCALPYRGTVFENSPEIYIEIRIADWPIDFICELNDWAEFLSGRWRGDSEHLHSYALARAEVVIGEVGSACPQPAQIIDIYRHAMKNRK